jgi:hypothetical protein
MRSRRVSALIAVARHVGTATLAGIITGILVGGLLGRVVMRVSGFTAGPGMVGSFTSNGNRVGEITFGGTLAIVIFVGVGSGLAGGVLYAVIEPWLRRLRPWHGLAYGALLLAAFGFTVLDASNFDFQLFGSAPLNVAMFAALFLLFGVGIAWTFDRLRALIAGTTMPSRTAKGLAFLVLLPGVVAAGLLVLSPGGLEDPLFPIAFLLGAVIAAFVRWRHLPTVIGYAALAAPILLGATRTIAAVPRIIGGY